ncbi:DNA mismatch repair protein MutS [candidate division WOR-3 bacterium]|nr:DNA mismatch repair protein MutS [candidate division WOR-3 bacterium]
MQKITPLLKQYFKVKSEYEDSILLFRMGDFYETFFKDAEIASSVLNIALTSRAHGKDNRIPLAGIPVKAADNYITKLIKAGLKVAICEQLEDPALAKGIVKRDVVEVITPGTVTNPNILDSGKNIFLAAISSDGKGKFGLSYCDLSTGDFFIEELSFNEILDELKRIEPGELLVSENDDYPFFDEFILTPLSEIEFQYGYALEKLKEHFNVKTLDGFGVEELNLGISAAGAILNYLNSTQKRKLKHIKKLMRSDLSNMLILDNSTVRNLELIKRFDGTTEGTLFSVLNETVTPMGTRYLRMTLLKPFYKLKNIKERLSAVDELYKKNLKVKTIRKILKSVSDIERLIVRIATERANARDLIQLKDSLSKIPTVKEEIREFSSEILEQIKKEMIDFSDVVKLISNAIVDSPPLKITEGGMIKDGFNEELDKTRDIVAKGKDWIVNLEREERDKTNITSLKVRYNSVFGYFIEVTKSNLKHVPDNYIRKQTLSNCERFITPELKEYETKVLGSEEKIKSMEYNIFSEIRTKVSQRVEEIQNTAKAIALLDLLLCFAFLSIRNKYSKPTVNNSDEIFISEGRHPVVETMIEKETFIPNDSYLDGNGNQILIITGPNMSGKSTYLRQVGLIIIMAQMGCFVPVKEAKIGVVDRVFTRIGASDDLSRGVSTFLAEMIETANILNNATKKSLVILDEVGRGTSTFDGLSIAWSVCEFLHNNPTVHPKTLFATHYHELTELEEILRGVKNYNVSVKRWEDKIIFLRKVVPGGADESYGVDVARLAGLPKQVINRAREILFELEEKEMKDLSKKRKVLAQNGILTKEEQLSLFSPPENIIYEELKNLDITALTPIDALNLLNEWKKRL